MSLGPTRAQGQWASLTYGQEVVQDIATSVSNVSGRVLSVPGTKRLEYTVQQVTVASTSLLTVQAQYAKMRGASGFRWITLGTFVCVLDQDLIFAWDVSAVAMRLNFVSAAGGGSAWTIRYSLAATS